MASMFPIQANPLPDRSGLLWAKVVTLFGNCTNAMLVMAEALAMEVLDMVLMNIMLLLLKLMMLI